MWPFGVAPSSLSCTATAAAAVSVVEHMTVLLLWLLSPQDTLPSPCGRPLSLPSLMPSRVLPPHPILTPLILTPYAGCVVVIETQQHVIQGSPGQHQSKVLGVAVVTQDMAQQVTHANLQSGEGGCDLRERRVRVHERPCVHVRLLKQRRPKR